MADTLVFGIPRRLLVDSRDPFADEAITAGASLIVAAPDANGQTFVSLDTTAVDLGTGDLSVAPGSEDANRTAGTDTITFSVPAAATPLVVTLE